MIWHWLRCHVDRSMKGCGWTPNEDEAIRFFRREKRASQQAIEQMRRIRRTGDPISNIYAGQHSQEEERS